MEEVAKKKFIAVKNARYLPRRTFTLVKEQTFDVKCAFVSAQTLRNTWWPVMAMITAWFHGHLACDTVNVHHRVIGIANIVPKL